MNERSFGLVKRFDCNELAGRRSLSPTGERQSWTGLYNFKSHAFCRKNHFRTNCKSLLFAVLVYLFFFPVSYYYERNLVSCNQTLEKLKWCDPLLVNWPMYVGWCSSLVTRFRVLRTPYFVFIILIFEKNDGFVTDSVLRRMVTRTRTESLNFLQTTSSQSPISMHHRGFGIHCSINNAFRFDDYPINPTRSDTAPSGR